MWTKAFWLDTVERALKTAAQVFATVLVAAGTGLLDTDWRVALSAAGMAALLSAVSSVGSGIVSPDGTASLVRRGDTP